MNTSRWFALAVSAVLLVAIGVACAKVPITGRRQYNLVPDKVMTALGKQQWASMRDGKPTEKSGDDVETLRRVGKRMSVVADRPDYAWETAMFKDNKTINAWCLPGGYIGFYTGILPVLQDESGMAFVMGHEVGHAVAHHGGERMSQQLTLFGGLGGLYLLLDAKTEMNTEQKALVLAAVGVGAEVGVILPFSRSHESEADVIGMMYMASAGYPPAQGIEVWARMDKLAGGGVPEFISTHPSNEHRAENMRDWLPQAKKRYARNKLSEDVTKVLWQ